MRVCAAHDDLGLEIFPGVTTDGAGRFRAERLVPGRSYGGTPHLGIGRPNGPAFEGLVLGTGEVRDLGDLRIRKPAEDVPRAGTDAVASVSWSR